MDERAVDRGRPAAARASVALGRRAILKVIGLFWPLALLVSSVAALATSYVYDGSGRLVAVSDDTGASARYTYDNIGNLLTVDRFAAGQLAVFAFAPGRGAPGTTVKIKGQGFSATASQNGVAFNGVAATVTVATTTELTATVPANATTGPISVTVGSAVASSATNFVVDAGAAGPTITSVAPTLASVGDQVAVVGTRLLPVAGQTSSLLNGRSVVPASSANTRIAFAVPPNVGSGKVTVTTPYGSATSAQDVTVVPPGIVAADVESTKRLTLNAAAQTLTVNTAGKAIAVLYDVVVGDLPSLQFSGLGTATMGYVVYGPTNASVASGAVSAAEPTAHLPRVVVPGTYMVLLRPSSAPLSWKLGVENAPQLTANGAVLAQPVIGAYQSKRQTFTATAGQNLGLGISDVVLPNGGSYIYATVYGPTGSTVTSNVCYASDGGCQLNLPNLRAGTYSIVFTPPLSGDRTMSFKSTLSTDVTGTLKADTAQSVSLGRRGQNSRLTFAGTAGQTVAVQVAGQATVPTGGTVYYGVYAPDGSTVGSGSATSATTVNLAKLPATGTYTVFVDPSYGETANVQVMLATGTTGGQVTNGASGSYATTIPGQNVYLTFKATAGQNLGLGISDVVLPNAGNYLYATVYGPEGNSVVGTTCYASNDGCQVNLPNLAAGTYSVVFTPPLDGDRTMSFKSTLSTDVTGTLKADTAQTLSLGRRGQNGRLTFAGTAGQTVALQIADQSTAPTGGTVYYTVYAPDGSAVGSGSASSATTVNLANLPATGTYTVFVDPYYGETASAQVSLATGTTGGQVTNGASGSHATTVTGQSVYLTFQATAGQNLGLALSDLVTPYTTSYVYLQVYKPDGSSSSSQLCYASNAGCQVNLVNTEAGTYSVVISPPSDGARTMSFKSTLSTDVTGTLKADTAQTLDLTRRGQNGRLTFAGTAGQTVALQIAGQSTVPSERTVYYTVYAPDGSTLSSTSTASSAAMNLANLPTTGTYTVFVDPYYGETASTLLTLATGTTGGGVLNGASGSHATTVAGQSVYLAFKATAGQNLGLALSELVTPYTASYVYLQVYKPDGSSSSSQLCYASNAGCQVNLVNTDAGTYSVVISPPSGGAQTMSFKSTLSTDVTGTLKADTAQALDLPRRGQNGRLTFAGTAGQTVALQVAGQSTVPSDRTVYYTVYRPDGSTLSSTSTTSSAVMNLANLPVTGTYTVFVDPYYGETASTQLTLASGTTGGGVLNGVSGNHATTVAGQSVYLTFEATAGQNLGLALSELVTPYTTSSVYLQVYKPDGSSSSSQYCSASNAGCQVNLVNTDAGTYSVVISPPSGGAQTMSFKSTLSTDVTGTLKADTAQTLDLTRRGQNGRLTFEGTAGQTVALQIAGQSTVPSDRTVYYAVYAPDGSTLSSTSATLSAVMNLANLPSTGTYTVFVDPSFGETASTQLTLATGTTGGGVLNGASGSHATTVAGQSIYLTFKATAGQSLGFALSELVTSYTTSPAYLQVYKPDGSSSSSQYCYAGNAGCQLNLVNTDAGTYSVVISPPSDGARTMSFKSTLSTDVTGTLKADTAQTLDLTRRGQNGRLTFEGTAGQTVALQIAGQSTVPSDRTVYYAVYAPDGSTLSSTSATLSAVMNLANLPSTGTYTVFVDPSFGETASTQLTLATGTTGGGVLNGASGSHATTVAGQSVYLTFKATAGQNLGLALSDLVTSYTTSPAYLQIYKPDGSSSSSQYCYASNAGCQLNLVNTEAGAYSVVISPPSGGAQTMSFKSTLSTDVTGMLKADTAQTLDLTRRGQNGRLTFAGTAGQTLALRVSAQSTTPAKRTVYYTVYQPDGSSLTSTSTTTEASLDIQGLPTTGSYTLLVDPYYGETSSTKLLLQSSN